MPLLQVFGMPGAIELLVIFVVVLLLFGIPLVLILGGGFLWFRSHDGADERVAKLEREVELLRSELRNTSSGEETAPSDDDSTDDS